MYQLGEAINYDLWPWDVELVTEIVSCHKRISWTNRVHWIMCNKVNGLAGRALSRVNKIHGYYPVEGLTLSM